MSLRHRRLGESTKVPVPIAVRAIREAIYREAGFSFGDELPVTAALGALFHRAVAGLLGADPSRHCHDLLANAEAARESWSEALRKHLYQSSIGPWIAENHVGLEPSTTELLVLWEAVGNFSAWAGGILWKAHQELGWSASARDLIICEESPNHEFLDPTWTDSVLVTGVADSVWRVPGGRWCVVVDKVYLLSTEVVDTANVGASLAHIGALNIHDCA